jgi:hypothetical protein
MDAPRTLRDEINRQARWPIGIWAMAAIALAMVLRTSTTPCRQRQLNSSSDA